MIINRMKPDEVINFYTHKLEAANNRLKIWEVLKPLLDEKVGKKISTVFAAALTEKLVCAYPGEWQVTTYIPAFDNMRRELWITAPWIVDYDLPRYGIGTLTKSYKLQMLMTSRSNDNLRFSWEALGGVRLLEAMAADRTTSELLPGLISSGELLRLIEYNNKLVDKILAFEKEMSNYKTIQLPYFIYQ